MLVQIGARSGAAPAPAPRPRGGVRPAAAQRLHVGSQPDPGGTAQPVVRMRPGAFGDVPPMGDLINGYAAHGLMLPKSLGQLYRTLREFVIAEDDEGRLLGCGALRIYDPGLAEVCSLAVADAARGLGVGRKVVEALHGEAAAFGIGRVFALTLEPGFFHRLGYETVDKAVLPQKIEADCLGCPRRDACNEIAVVKVLSQQDAEEER